MLEWDITMTLDLIIMFLVTGSLFLFFVAAIKHLMDEHEKTLKKKPVKSSVSNLRRAA